MLRRSRMLRSSSTTRTRAAVIASPPWRPPPAGSARRWYRHWRRPAGSRLPVIAYDPVHEGEPEPAAPRLRREEGLEDVGLIGAGDAVAGVADHQIEPMILEPRAHA